MGPGILKHLSVAGSVDPLGQNIQVMCLCDWSKLIKLQDGFHIKTLGLLRC